MALTWLHVSDFHLSSKAPYDSDVVLNGLIESVEWYRLNTEWKPDIIFVTGDIAGKGDVAIFKGGDAAPATKFFDALLKAAGQTRERLFVVPGNHDVERKKGIGLVRTLDTQTEIDEYFTESPMYHLTCKLEVFSLWYNDYFSAIPAPRCFPKTSTCQLISYPINDIRLVLLLLNSTLFCKDAATDAGKLCIGRSCLNPFINQLENEKENRDLAIALVHHPLECLHTGFERLKLKQSLKKQVDILLQGHFHQTEVDPGEDLIQLAAGATYVDNGTKKALYGCFDGKVLNVFPIRYQEESEVWRVDPDVFSEEISHIKSYTIPRNTNPTGTNDQPDKGYEQYQAFLIAKLDHAPPPLVQALFPAKVSKIFVSLRLSDTWQSEERHTPEAKEHDRQNDETGFSPEQVMKETFKENHLMLVIGDPGSGKTTLLKHYALSCLDEGRCENFGFTKPVMVFYLRLRELKKRSTGYDSLPASICAWAEKRALTIHETVYSQWLKQKKTLVLLDGLDEISELDERKAACKWIDKTIIDFPNACFVVTSRPTGYRRVDLIGFEAPLKRADILDFRDKQKKIFLEQWFTEFFLAKVRPDSQEIEEWKETQIENAQKKAAHIIEFLKRDENKSIRQLAGIPLLLQIMVMLWSKRDIKLDSRATLYKNALDYFLANQYNQRDRASLLPEADALGVLAPVALWMQEELGNDEADSEAMKTKIQDELNKIPKEQNPPEAKSFSDDLINHAGLLVEFGDSDDGATEYAFCHKSFREYLTGFQLMKNGDKSTKTLIDHFSDDWWEEPLRYYFGQIDAKTFNNFMQSVFDSQISEELSQKKQALLRTIIEETPKKKRKIDALCKKLLDPVTTANRQWVILDCLKAIGKSEALAALQEFSTKKLAKNDTLDVIGRTAEVIRALGGKVIDPETEKVVYGTTLSILNPNEQNAEYILIKKGSYLDSKTNKRKDVENDLYFAKYPLTNKRYRSFIAALGQSSKLQEELNTIAQKNTWGAGFSSYLNKGKHDLATLFRSENDEDRKFDGDDQPVVGITWYAANAYCLWLSQLEDRPDSYRLPTEFEWEWAAGGKRESTPQKVREYPWADEKGQPNSTLLNYHGNVGATTPVGNYPDGATPEGLYDMAGNVWEWTESLWDETGSCRVVRGGSWYFDAEYCRSAYRGSGTSGSRRNIVGFRLVFVP